MAKDRSAEPPRETLEALLGQWGPHEALIRAVYELGFRAGEQTVLAEVSEVCRELAEEADVAQSEITSELLEDLERPYLEAAPSPILAARSDGLRDGLTLLQAALSGRP